MFFPETQKEEREERCQGKGKKAAQGGIPD